MNNTNPERTITVLGSLENCKNAESMISQKLRVSYESDMAQFIPVIILFTYFSKYDCILNQFYVFPIAEPSNA